MSQCGTYLEYSLDITVTGLLGLQTGSEIVANNDPTAVNGSFSGLFHRAAGDDGDGDANLGFYTIDLDFDMENWAFANNGSLNGEYTPLDGNISDSLFVANVPVPAAAWLFGSALLGLGALKRKKA